ncbi:MAG: quinolinate synthase NadA [Verrucomicrobia bacterium]|nr:quinolinate synthase NadA [Verrucomicrobiota bacterium]
MQTADETTALTRQIADLKRERDALILAHNYQRPEVQDIADHTGDSLELSRIAAGASQGVIVFCGVQFMAETAATLCPDKTVLLPVRDAGCPLADRATAEQVRQMKARHPEARVVAYVNTSAEVKAESDLCCTSANALDVVRSVDPQRPILFVSDRNLGHYAGRMAGRRVLLWDGSCPIHAALSTADIRQSKRDHPEARVMAHPECQPDVLELVDRVAGTAGMLAYAAQQAPHTSFIVGTDIGLIHRLKKENPDKAFYPATDYLVCPTMKLTTLADVRRSLERMEHVVRLEEPVRVRAGLALEAMLAVPSTP